MTELNIVPYTADLLPLLVDLAHEANAEQRIFHGFIGNPDDKQVAHWFFNRGAQHVWVARNPDDTVVGAVSLARRAVVSSEPLSTVPSAEVCRFITTEAGRVNGASHALVDVLVSHAHDNGIKRLWLTVPHEGGEKQAWADAGWVEAGETLMVLSGNALAQAVVMVKEL